MGWFAVRTFYRTAPVGRPRRPDQHYIAAVAAVEERVVLFRAKSGAAALKRATAEGREYAAAVCRNRYGQRVVTKLLKRADAHELDERPGEGTETTAHMFIDGGIAAELERRCVDGPMKPAHRTLQRRARMRRRRT